MSAIHTALLYIQQNWFELTALVISILGVWLTALEKTINWPVNILACVLYGIVFYNSGIYLDASLQLFFIVFGVYGWYMWTKGGTQGGELRITKMPGKTYLVLLGIGIPSVFLLVWLLPHLTEWLTALLHIAVAKSTIPYFDSTTTVLSLIATWMAAKKYIENWLLWIITDLIYVPEYVIKDLYATAILYFIFTLLAVYGYFEWRKLKRKLTV
ncbi:MAG TPA: nicotinamide riboside transporter PnuC [Bacteroidia bacterium]|nr:nicotinamide riboside transporter PnuC [Bacteroidia bacterium]